MIWFRNFLALPLTLTLLLFFVVGVKLRNKIDGVPIIEWVFVLYAVIFAILDVIYNVVIGTFIFWSMPREWLYTDRLIRWKCQNVDPKRKKFAQHWCGILERYDPGHCNCKH